VRRAVSLRQLIFYRTSEILVWLCWCDLRRYRPITRRRQNPMQVDCAVIHVGLVSAQRAWPPSPFTGWQCRVVCDQLERLALAVTNRSYRQTSPSAVLCGLSLILPTNVDEQVSAVLLSRIGNCFLVYAYNSIRVDCCRVHHCDSRQGTVP